MSYIMEGYTRNARGGISNRRFPSDQFPGPSEGWYDSPDKVPLLPGQKAEPAPIQQRVSQSESVISANLGTKDPNALTNQKTPKGGWPKGARRGADGKMVR